MNYKNLLEKITHKNYMGGVFSYYGKRVNVTLGTDNMNVYIEKDGRAVAQFGFTFEIPRYIVFHNMDKKLSNCISKNLNIIYDSMIPVYYEP